MGRCHQTIPSWRSTHPAAPYTPGHQGQGLPCTHHQSPNLASAAIASVDTPGSMQRHMLSWRSWQPLSNGRARQFCGTSYSGGLAHRLSVAAWLWHAMRQVTPDDFPPSWRAGDMASRSHDSGYDDHTFGLRLDEVTSRTLEILTQTFQRSAAEMIHQLMAQAPPEDVPQSWHLAVIEPQRQEARPGGGRVRGSHEHSRAPSQGRLHRRCPRDRHGWEWRSYRYDLNARCRRTLRRLDHVPSGAAGRVDRKSTGSAWQAGIRADATSPRVALCWASMVD